MSKMELKEKVVVITGASSGIGMALATAFAAEGAHLVLAARNHVKLLEIATQLKNNYGIQVIAVATDVSKEIQCKQLMDQALVTFGKIDVLINNAGISMRALFEEVDLKVLAEVMDINFWGTVFCTKHALAELIASKGVLVGVSSIAGYKGLPGRTGYSASKFAMQGFLESVRVENLYNGLSVLIACPGFTASNIRSMARSKDGLPQGESPMDEKNIMQPAQVALEIVQAVKQRKRSLILTFQGKLTVWLAKHFPALADQLIFNHFAKEPDSPLKK
jgi:short-subunit dehydrogenase